MRMFTLAALAAAVLGTAGHAAAADRLGIVLMHGKQGQPDKAITGLASALTREGHLVASPEMCWSKRRIYDKPFDACIAELDKAVDSPAGRRRHRHRRRRPLPGWQRGHRLCRLAPGQGRRGAGWSP
ncbi:MAG: hypothetical protein NVV74_13205 [Magnetospirillum sp.]|nr:hypothetical protein [Magnetospirillum sp.]